MNPNHTDASLRRILKLQVVMEVVSGIPMLAASGWLAASLQLPRNLFLILGGLGLLFGAQIYHAATRPQLQTRAVWNIIGSNAVFAILSAIVLLAGWFDTNALGTAFIVANIIFSTVFAELEIIAFRRKRPTVAATA